MLQQQVLHADETPVIIMQMGDDEKKPKKGYIWAYATTQYNPVQAVIYDFQDSRSGQHAEEFLKGWQGIWSVMITVVIKHALNQAMSLRWAAWRMHVVNSMNCM